MKKLFVVEGTERNLWEWETLNVRFDLEFTELPLPKDIEVEELIEALYYDKDTVWMALDKRQCDMLISILNQLKKASGKD